MTPFPSSFQAGDVRREDFVPAPIPAIDVLDGQPRARSCDLSASQDGGLSMNLWDCSAGSFRWFFGSDELVQILEGEVRVTDEAGSLTVLGAGSTAHFPAGSETVWDVPDYVKKLAVHRCPASLPARAVHKVKLLRTRALRTHAPRRRLAAHGIPPTLAAIAESAPL